MDIRNKKIAFLGDSITEGFGTSSVENVYWNVLSRNSGAKCYGYGIGGTRIAPQHSETAADTGFDRYFASRIDGMIPDADIVVVFGGTNDFGHGDAPFGTQADRTEETFCGALHVLMQKLINRYPAATIIFVTPLHRCGDDDMTVNELNVRRCADLKAYVDAIIDAAAFYGLPVLDLFRVSGLQPNFPVLRELFVPDGLHPNDRGHVRIADRLAGFLCML